MGLKVIDSVKKTISVELQELQFLQERVDENYEKAVSSILKSKGKVVVTGIGKSAHIGIKMVATLNSTGTPAQFLHAAEAMHGDLGLLQKEDVILCISNSGNSSEIRTLVPFLKEKSSYVIAITGNKDSFLAKHADCILNSHVTQEACPNQLAPTSSTTVQLVICDALAVALMEEKEFEAEDFAQFHPGGSLGRKLVTKVKDLVRTQHKPQLDVDKNVQEVILSLSSSPYGITVVLHNNTIEGVITDGDLRRHLSQNPNFLQLSAKDIMSVSPKTIQKEELAVEAMRILQKYDIGQLIVLNGEEYYGIIEIHQLLEEGIV